MSLCYLYLLFVVGPVQHLPGERGQGGRVQLGPERAGSPPRLLLLRLHCHAGQRNYNYILFENSGIIFIYFLSKIIINKVGSKLQIFFAICPSCAFLQFQFPCPQYFRKYSKIKNSVSSVDLSHLLQSCYMNILYKIFYISQLARRHKNEK